LAVVSTTPEPDHRDIDYLEALYAAPAAEPATLAPTDEDAPPVPVDHSLPVGPPKTARRPVLPSWAHSWQQAGEAAGFWLAHAWHTTTFHAVRLPVYWGRLAARSPVGAYRLVRGWGAWALDVEGKPLRQTLAGRGDTPQMDAAAYAKLTQLHDAHVRNRLLTSVLGAGGLGFTALVLVSLPVEALAIILVVALAVLGLAGRSPDKPVVSRAVDRQDAPNLTSEMILRALAGLGLGEMNKALKKGEGVGFPAPIVRDGKGFRADIDLPHGVTASDIMDRRENLASGLRRPLGCVWPEGAHDEHAGRLILWVGDQPIAKTKQPPWALLKRGQVDLFNPIPFGTDQRGRWVDVTLMFANVVIGAVPRQGKTFSLRVLLLASALDPRAQLHLYDLKGTGDLSALEIVAHRYRCGDDEDDIEYAVEDLRELQREMRRRTRVIRELPRSVCPESKVTPELAKRADLGLHPIVIGVDECQRWFEHPTHGKELESITTDLVKRGPALGIIVMLATQRPDAKSLPTGISANAVIRFCLKVMGQVENDMVLGTSAYKNGTRATMFSRRDVGIGYLVGEGEEPKIVRTTYIDNPAAETLAIRARAAREAAGLLTGHAAGQVPEAPKEEATLLHDLLAVIPPSEPRVWGEVCAERLALYRPAIYEGWGTEQLTTALKPYNIRPVQIAGMAEGKRVNRRGVVRSDLEFALSQL
jgi:DNA segregation ATPase FtsK/SpoIIIE, S-DNA-T family